MRPVPAKKTLDKQVLEPEQGEYWQYSQEEWEQWEKREASLSQGRTANGGNPTKTFVCPKAPAGQKGARKRSSARRSLQVNGGQCNWWKRSRHGCRLLPRRVREQKTSEEVQPKEAKLEDGQEKEDGNKASQKVAKREKEVGNPRRPYYSSDDEKSEEEEEGGAERQSQQPSQKPS